jgi:homoserine acetyltransferase
LRQPCKYYLATKNSCRLLDETHHSPGSDTLCVGATSDQLRDIDCSTKLIETLPNVPARKLQDIKGHPGQVIGISPILIAAGKKALVRNSVDHC